MSIEYRVEETTSVTITSPNPEEWETVTAWKIVRHEGNFGSSVAQYRDEEVAARVSGILSDFAALEAP